MSALHLHRGAPYQVTTLARDQSPSGRRECGFRIECGEHGCTEIASIPGPPNFPPDVVIDKFKKKGWFVSDRGPKRNRCPDHARAARAAPIERPSRAATAAELLFKSPAELEAMYAARDAAPPAAPNVVARIPRQRVATPQAPPPQAAPMRRTATPATLKTQVFRQLGIDGDLDKIHRSVSNMLKLTQQHVRTLEAVMVTVEDAQRRIGQMPEARHA